MATKRKSTRPVKIPKMNKEQKQKFNELVEKLESFDIQVKYKNGNYKLTMDVLNQLTEKWKQLTQSEKDNLSEDICNVKEFETEIDKLKKESIKKEINNNVKKLSKVTPQEITWEKIENKKIEELDGKDNKNDKEIKSTFYDENYFENGIASEKSSYAGLVWEDRYLEIAQDLIKEFKSTKVLDIGCAKGFLIRAFKQYGIYAVGCDISEYAIKNCDPNVKNFVNIASITNLKGYRTGAFDLVLVYDLVEHLTDEQLDLAIQELKRVVSNDGVITLKTPDKVYDWDNDKSHINIKPLDEWVKLFAKYGLKKITPKAKEKYWGAFDYRRTLFFKKG